MNNYVKLTPEAFLAKLKEGGYTEVAGARRAVGKAAWSEASKDTARTAIDKFFGASSSSAKPAKKAAKTAEPAKRGRKPRAEKAETKKDDEEYLAVPSDRKGEAVAVSPRSVTLEEIRRNPFQVIQLAERGVASGTSALNAVSDLKKQNPEIEIDATVESAVKTIQRALEITSLVLASLPEDIASPEEVTYAEANGVGATGGSVAYEAPLPEA